MTTKESGEDMKSELPDEKVQEKGHVPMARGGRDEEMAMAVVCYSNFFSHLSFVSPDD
jgi:hypothetical protein